MFRKIFTKALVLQIAVSWLVPSIVIGTTRLAFAGYIGVPMLRSQGPCLFSLQLQKSVAERRHYLVKLSSVTGGAFPGNSAVEEMYNNIKTVSYGSEEAPTDSELLGFTIKDTKLTQGSIDTFSTDCISCHDGANAVSIEANLKNDPFGRRLHSKSSGSDHPIGMDYESYVAANAGKYKPVFGLNSKMVFINGKVGCLTCHDPMNPEKGHLVMSDEKSALCLSCHDK